MGNFKKSLDKLERIKNKFHHLKTFAKGATQPFPCPRTQKSPESYWKPGFYLRQNVVSFLKCPFPRTAYAKGFPKESTTLDELIEYYNESNPDVVSIQMRNYCEKKGKEKVLFIFSSPDTHFSPILLLGVEIQRLNLPDIQDGGGGQRFCGEGGEV